MDAARTNTSGGSDLSDYTYDALPISSSDAPLCVRLLALQPGPHESPLHGTLLIIQHDEAPPYTALSYSWGSGTRETSICIDKRSQLPMTLNLEAGLRRIRHSFVIEMLWIDAICIDQSNPRERSHQVSGMHHIYQDAEKVLVWLGETTRKPNAKDSVLEEDIEDLESLSMHMGNFVWWKRLWVLQEFILNRRPPIFLLGPLRFTVLQLHWRLDKYLQQRKANPSSDPDAYALETTLDQLSKILALRMQHEHETEPQSFVQMLDATATQHCADDRDRIFAILSIVPERDRAMLKADYTKSAAQLFAEVLFHLTRHEEIRIDTIRTASSTMRLRDRTTLSEKNIIDERSVELLPYFIAETAGGESGDVTKPAFVQCFSAQAWANTLRRSRHHQSGESRPLKRTRSMYAADQLPKPYEIVILPTGWKDQISRQRIRETWVTGIRLGSVDHELPTSSEAQPHIRMLLQGRLFWTLTPNTISHHYRPEISQTEARAASTELDSVRRRFVAVMQQPRSLLREYFVRHLPTLAEALDGIAVTLPPIYTAPPRTASDYPSDYGIDRHDLVVAAVGHKMPLILRPTDIVDEFQLVDYCIEDHVVGPLAALRAHLGPDMLERFKLVPNPTANDIRHLFPKRRRRAF